MSRRESLKALLQGLLGSAGTVVVAASVLPTAAGEEAAAELAQRADLLAGPAGPLAAMRGWVNGGFRNAGFRNAAFRNGGFANGGFRNAGFRNGAFRNF
jgi:hypothetical protein